MLILAFDPGDKNNGYAMFKYNTETKKADLKTLSILTADQLSNVLLALHGLAEKAHGKCTFVIENFRVDTMVRGNRGRHNTQMFQWNEMQTIRQIGKIEMVANWTGSKCVFQEPRILDAARKWCDFPLPKGHIPDDKSAYIHGAHYMMKEKMINTVDQITKFGQETIG